MLKKWHVFAIVSAIIASVFTGFYLFDGFDRPDNKFLLIGIEVRPERSPTESLEYKPTKYTAGMVDTETLKESSVVCETYTEAGSHSIVLYKMGTSGGRTNIPFSATFYPNSGTNQWSNLNGDLPIPYRTQGEETKDVSMTITQPKPYEIRILVFSQKDKRKEHYEYLKANNKDNFNYLLCEIPGKVVSAR